MDSNENMSTKLIVLPENTLSVLICTNCHMYLSVGQVYIFRYRVDLEVICGRCLKKYKDKRRSLILTKSLYNVVAPYCLFKCINQFSGCRKLLYWNEAIAHDKICSKQQNQKCFDCDIKSNNVVELIYHYSATHPHRIIKDGKILLKFEPVEDYAILKLPSDLLKFEWKIGNRLLTIRAVRLSEQFNSIILNYQIVCSNVTNSRLYVSESQEISKSIKISATTLANVMSDENSVQLRISLSGTEQPNVLMEQFQLKELTKNNFLKTVFLNVPHSMEDYFEACFICSGCGDVLEGINWYICENDHIYCHNCNNNNINGPTCDKIHHKQQEKGLFKVLVTDKPNQFQVKKIAPLFKLKCSWLNCNIIWPPETTARHRKTCVYRQFKCPANNCNVTCTLENLKLHWHLKSPLEVTKEMFLPLKNEYTFFWMPLKANDLFKVYTQYFSQIKNLIITVYSLSTVSDATYTLLLNDKLYNGSKFSCVTRIIVWNIEQHDINKIKLMDTTE